MSATESREWVEAPVPEELEGATLSGPVHQVAPGHALVTLPGLARALVTREGPPRIERASGVPDADLDWLAAGPLAQTRDALAGRFAMRASCVSVDGRAVALVAGPAGGKSLVAAALAQRGHPVLADGYLPVEPGVAAMAMPYTDRLEIWPRAAELIGLDPEGGEEIRPGLKKRGHRFAGGDPAPLALVVRLVRDRLDDPAALTPLRGGAMISLLVFATAMRPPLDGAGHAGDHFRWAVRVAQATRGAELRTPGDVDDAPELAVLVERAVREGVPAP